MISLVRIAADAYTLLIIVRVILSWLSHNPYHPVIKLVYQVTEPPLRLIRSYIPSVGGLDLSPLILLLAVYLLEKILIRILIII